MPTNNQNPDSTGENLREQLRVGVRMLEALELQITRAQDMIQREDDARHRAEETISRLTELESRLRSTIDFVDGNQNSLAPTEQLPSRNQGNDQLARKLRRLAEQLIEAADGNTNTHEAPEEHTIGIAVEKPVELNLVSPKIIETARD